MSKVSPIMLEIMRNGFQSIADEMTAALVRTAYSPNIKDRRDCSCAVLNTEGVAVAQTELGTPFHVAVISAAARAMLARHPVGTLREGDTIVSNLPYPFGPGHLSDVTILAPVICDGRTIALVANQAHHVDVGGYAPGSMPAGVTEIYQEGLQIPPVKLVKGGKVDEELFSILLQNIRTPNVTRGDMLAQVAANNVGGDRLKELCHKHGPARLAVYMRELLDYAERSMRAGIRKLAKGSYSFQDYVEGDGITDHLFKIKATVTVREDTVEVDFAGTDPQAKGPINARISAAEACVWYVMKCIIDPDLPSNGGAYRPITVTVPEGSLLQARFPAAVCSANVITDQRIVDVVLGALLGAAPDRVTAACSGEMNLVNIGGVDPRNGQYFSYVETTGGGQGASSGQDGMDGVQTHMTNTRNTPTEVLELDYPLRVEKYGLVRDSEGAGRFRGGLGITREMVLLADEARLTLGADRRKIGPWGACGGLAAAPSDCVVVSKDGKRNRLPPKVTTVLTKGDTLIIRTPGGGGWGNPRRRDPKKLTHDVQEGLISAGRAKSVYGPAGKASKRPRARQGRARKAPNSGR